jgi:hypothetical protein
METVAVSRKEMKEVYGNRESFIWAHRLLCAVRDHLLGSANVLMAVPGGDTDLIGFDYNHCAR